jgi:hypothetical protein
MRATSIAVCLVGLLMLFVSFSDAAEMRKWTRKNGKEFDAEFVKREGHEVTLKKPDGTEMTVKMGGLSDDDRNYVKQQVPSEGKPETKDNGGQKSADKPATPTSAEMRTWTRVDGTTIEASYVSFEHRRGKNPAGINVVTLRQSDGTKVTVRLMKLSQRDQEYVEQRLKSEGKPVPWVKTEVQPKPVTTESPKPEPVKTEVQPALRGGNDKEDKGKGIENAINAKTTIIEVLDKIKDERVLLQRILKGFPANCVTAQVVGDPKPVKYDEQNQKATVRVKVKVGVDEKAFATFRKRLLAVLEDFKEEDGMWEESWAFELGGQLPPKKGALQDDSEYVRVKNQDKDQKAVTDDVTVYVNSERDEAWTGLKWKAFDLHQMLQEVFNDAAKRHGECVLSIVSKAGDTIPLDRFSLDDERLGGTTPVADRVKYGNGGRTFFISPTFLRDADCSKHRPTVTISRDVEMSDSLLDHLQALKCEVRFVTSGKDRD